MKVVFLDIDGVLNTNKTALLHGSIFVMVEDVHKYLDADGLNFLKMLVASDVKIVLSSTWRMGCTPEFTSKQLDLPIHSHTIISDDDTRGVEIKEWLDRHPEVTDYCIIDDDSDMLLEQCSKLMLIDGEVGITYVQMEDICKLLNLDLSEVRNKFVKEKILAKTQG